MRSLKNILLISCIGLLMACNSHIERKIINYVQKECLNKNNDTCRIDLREVLKVDYDCLYLFGEFTQPDKISSIMGIPYKSDKTITDSNYRVILLKNSNIVYESDFSSGTMYFYEITDKIDMVNRNTYYLVHYSPYYLVIKGKNNRMKDHYSLETISDKIQYSRTVYDWQKGYTFEEILK